MYGIGMFPRKTVMATVKEQIFKIGLIKESTLVVFKKVKHKN